MKKTICLAILIGTTIWAQAAASPQAQPAGAAAAKAAAQNAVAAQSPKPVAPSSPALPPPSMTNVFTMPANTVYAIVDGQEITAGDIQGFAKSSPQAQQQIMHSPKAFLEYYGMMRRLSAQAVAEKLDEKVPYKQFLENARMGALAQIMATYKHDAAAPTPEELHKAYEAKMDYYKQVKLKAIYIPFSPTANPPAGADGKKPLTDADAKTKAEALVKEIRGGADFVKLVKENSEDATSKAKDGDFGMMRRTDAAWPEAMKTTILNTKPGEVTDPLRQASGYYIFRIEEVGPESFDEVSRTLQTEVQTQKFNEWMTSLRSSVVVKLANDPSTGASQPASAAPAAHPPVAPATK